MKTLKHILIFNNDDEEIMFWENHDLTEYVDWE